jgi:DNA-directed RNA polymerase subunit M/transcription elongation factor TFIIS
LNSCFPKDPIARYDKIQQIAYNLSENKEYLLKTYTPEALVTANDGMLNKNSELETHRSKQKKELDSFHELLQKDFLTGVADGLSVMKCRRCGNGGIEFTTKQVNSADEGSTTFCRCPTCRLRWKMN